MAVSAYLLISLFFTLCLGQFQASDFKQKVCLYSSANNGTVLTPLQLQNSNCPSNTSYCMNSIYKYGNFQYNGPAKIKPNQGEVVMFLSQDQAGRLDYVTFLNAKVDTTLKVWVQITGADPVPIILYDDPTADTWAWSPEKNQGNFTWITKPTYTDGVIIGHITFIDNYCLRSSYTQPNAALDSVTIMSGNVTHPVRILTVPYQSGKIFEFCQYPRTASTSKDVTCPGRSDGSASIWIEFGPQNVEYKWYNDAGTIVGTTSSITGVRAGIYHVYVNDTSSGNGCTADRTITIREPTLLPATVATTQFACSTKGSASATPRGGSGGFTFEWFKADGTSIGTGSSIGNLNVGSYYVTVTDSCGSVATTSFSITSVGCCGDGICQANEACGQSGYCKADCGVCCPPGTYRDGSRCTVCPPGRRSNATNAASCDACPANTFSSGGSDPCVACPANYVSTAGSGKCTRCAEGQVRPSGETSCRGCGTGMFASGCDDATCMACPVGTYASTEDQSVCQPCNPGTYAAGGSKICSSCGDDEYAGARASSCTPCPNGTFYTGREAWSILHCN